MQIELIDTFLDLMETNSFNRTAERLGIKQSTVSNRVMALEAALGRKLFSRSRAGTRPTTAGHRFLDHARDLRHQWNEARRTVQTAGDPTRMMRIGIQNDLAATHIGEWVTEFRKAFPQTAFYFEVDYSNQMSSDVLSGELDLAVLFTPRQSPDLHYENIGETRYRLVSTEARLRADIAPERYIFGNYSPSFEKTHRASLHELTAATVSSGQNAAVCGLLASLGGAAFVLEDSAAALVESGGFHAVADVDPIPQPVYVAIHVRHRHAHAHNRIVAILRHCLAAATPPIGPISSEESPAH